MTTNSELLARRNKAVPRGVAHATPVYADRAENGEHREYQERACKAVDLAAGKEAEDHEQRMQAKSASHHVRNDNVPLDLLD